MRVIDNSQSRDEIRELFQELWAPPGGSWFRLNLVMTKENQVVGPDHASKSISSANDRLLLGVIRKFSDAILVGASTSRNELIASEKSKPVLVISHSGNVDLSRLSPGSRVVAPSGSNAANLPNALVFDFDPNPLNAANNLRKTIISEGFENVVCEGGPSTAKWLISGEFFDEICLTRSNKRGFGPSYDLDFKNWEVTMEVSDSQGFTYNRLHLISARG